LVLIILFAGCGGDGDSPAPATPEAPKTDEELVAEVGERYIAAIVDKDWEAACATRTDAEQEEFDRLAGSCEKGFEAILDRPGASLIFDGVEVVNVRVKGNRATFDFAHPGQEPFSEGDPLQALKENGEWRLGDVEG
jgi:hypothetical protein